MSHTERQSRRWYELDVVQRAETVRETIVRMLGNGKAWTVKGLALEAGMPINSIRSALLTAVHAGQVQVAGRVAVNGKRVNVYALARSVPDASRRR